MEDIKSVEIEDIKAVEIEVIKSVEMEDIKSVEIEDIKAVVEIEDIKSVEMEDIKSVEIEDIKAVEIEDIKALLVKDIMVLQEKYTKMLSLLALILHSCETDFSHNSISLMCKDYLSLSRTKDNNKLISHLIRKSGWETGEKNRYKEKREKCPRLIQQKTMTYPEENDGAEDIEIKFESNIVNQYQGESGVKVNSSSDISMLNKSSNITGHEGKLRKPRKRIVAKFRKKEKQSKVVNKPVIDLFIARFMKKEKEDDEDDEAPSSLSLDNMATKGNTEVVIKHEKPKFVKPEIDEVLFDKYVQVIPQPLPVKRSSGRPGDYKKFVCKVCQYSSKKKSVLWKHIPAHSNERGHLCDLCGASYKRKSGLAQHKILHSGVKSFLCKICNKAFARKHNLRVHRFTHTEGNPFKCDLCDANFKSPYDLNKHKRTHRKGEKSELDVSKEQIKNEDTLRDLKPNHSATFVDSPSYAAAPYGSFASAHIQPSSECMTNFYPQYTAPYM